MKTQKRAKVGGEVGANGEFYEGGRFLNTVPENQKKEGSKPRKARKVQIAPYVWVMAEEGRRPIFAAFSGFEKALIENNLSLIAPQTVAYYGLDMDRLAELAKRYHAGERWA